MEYTSRPSKRKQKLEPVICNDFADALKSNDPIWTLWPSLVSLAFGDAQKVSLSNLSREARTVYLALLFEREVFNEGISGFFGNSAGNFVLETEAALQELNATRLLSILKRGASLFPDGVVPSDWEQRRLALSDIPEESLNLLDEEFNRDINSSPEEVHNLENPWFLILAYIRNHPQAKLAVD